MKLNFLEKYVLKRISSREQKASRTAGAIVTGIPGGVVWPDRNYENFARETYMKNWITFRCIDLIAKSTGSVPWKLLRRVDERKYEPVPDHPINMVLKRPNPRESLTFLVYSIISYLCFAGNTFIEKVGPSTGPNQANVRELYSLRPDRFKINTDKEGNIISYSYNINGQEVTYEVDIVTGRCDILHLKLFHPLDDFWGMSPTEPGAISIDTHNSSSTWNKNLVENEGKPGAVFMFEGALSDIQFKRLQDQIKEYREGPKNAGKSLIIEGGKDIKPFGFSPQEMDWIKSNLEMARNICNVYGVPPQLVGIPDTNTYSNYQEARLSFWEETVIFYLNFLKDEFNHWLFPETYFSEEIMLSYILDDVPALSVKRDAVWKRAQDTDFLKINEKREMVDYEEVEGGDVLLVPATMLPLGESGMSEEETVEEEEDAVKKLMEGGMSREEALNHIGVPTE